ncbi:MFS transporter [Gryllotalpicola protaetiae]|uniref:DHA2 family efflux MFS transporter permease subunit n=1 Tax=Gryllotalpicola protaetiae TaxID=2419771 RepID=A0A387BYP3_9MICO|nr:MFS transporter [Gryllotalpicola protaetiae]AYG03461.1 DHA2 family efflux MFS transporter permease subunit [Gryllotalpicola protaetiae]
MTETTSLPLAASPGASRAPRAGHPGAALGVAMLGFFVVALDSQVVNVALPSIRHDLGGGLSGLQWIVTGYTLMFSALILFAGTLSERVGAKRAYGAGMILFVLASAACGLAPNLPVLIGARFVQGLGAALITPTALALIREAYQDARKRARAIAYWAMGGSIAAAAGPIVGGALTQVDWRIIFYLNLPVGIIALLILFRVGTSPRREHPFDWTGQIAAVAGLAALTYAIIEGGSHGYGQPLILTGFAVFVIAVIVFLTAQQRGMHPMVPLDLFRSRRVIVALAAAFIGMVGFYGVVFIQSLYFQQLRGASPLTSGLLFLPMTACVAALSPIVPRVAARFGLRVPIVGGQALMVAGLVALACIPVSAPTWVVAVLMVPVGVGGSFTVPPLTSLLIDSIPASRTGTASGVLNMFRQMGGSLGVAAVGAVIAVQTSFMTGLRISLIAIAVLVAITTIASLTLRHVPHE